MRMAASRMFWRAARCLTAGLAALVLDAFSDGSGNDAGGAFLSGYAVHD
jgi:hypothetical protein